MVFLSIFLLFFFGLNLPTSYSLPSFIHLGPISSYFHLSEMERSSSVTYWTSNKNKLGSVFYWSLLSVFSWILCPLYTVAATFLFFYFFRRHASLVLVPSDLLWNIFSFLQFRPENRNNSEKCSFFLFPCSENDVRDQIILMKSKAITSQMQDAFGKVSLCGMHGF